MGKAAWMRETMRLREEVKELKAEIARRDAEGAAQVDAPDATPPAPVAPAQVVQTFMGVRGPGRPRKNPAGE